MVAIVGASGTGKSYSIRNLPIARTKILNIERKPFPFKHGFEYGDNDIQCENVTVFDQKLDSVLKDTTVDFVVIESLTKYFEMLLAFSKSINKGYDIYNFYNDRITLFLERLKANKNKVVFCLATDEIVIQANTYGIEIANRRIKVAGKQWEGVIEKEFALVLYTDVRQEKGKQSEYRFMTNNDGTCSAKSPPDLFNNTQFIPNDLFSVATSLYKYYGLQPINTQKPETTLLDAKL